MSTLKEALENGGMSFAKIENNQLIFKLTEDLSVEEDFKVWDNQNKKFMNASEELVATTGETIKVGQTKGLRSEVFKQFFPNKSKKTQFIRNIVVNDQPCRFGFSYTANENLNTLIKNIRALGSNYLQSTFILSKSGSGLDTEYKIEILPVEKLTEMAQKPLIHTNPSNVGLKPQTLNLGGLTEARGNLSLQQESSAPSSDLESQYLNTFKTQVPKNLWSLDNFIKIAVSNNIAIPEYRLEALFKGL